MANTALPIFLPGQRTNGPSFGTEAQRLALTDVFGPQFEGAVIMRQVSLHTEEMRKLIRRDYLFLSRMLHTITRTRQYSVVEHAPLNRIEDEIKAKIAAVRELIATRRTEVARRFNKAPDATVDVTHARTTTFEAPIASPHANAYLDLLVEADEYLARATACWLQGLMGSQEYNGGGREIKRALLSVKADVTKARTMCYRLLDRASNSLEATDPEALELKAAAAEMATGLVADAKSDREVQEAISISDGHDLDAAAAAAASTSAGSDVPKTEDNPAQATATDSASKKPAEAAA